MDTKGFGEKQRRHSQSHRNRLCLLPYIHIHRHILPEVRRRLTIVGFTMVTSYVDRPSRLDETWKFRVILYIDFVSKGVCFHIHQTCKGKVGVAQELAIQLFILLTTRLTWQQNWKNREYGEKIQWDSKWHSRRLVQKEFWSKLMFYAIFAIVKNFSNDDLLIFSYLTILFLNNCISNNNVQFISI